MTKNVYRTYTNFGRRKILRGDYVIFKPYVARKYGHVIRAFTPNARASYKFCGLAATDARIGEKVKVLVYGYMNP